MLGSLLLALSTTLLPPGSQSQRVSPFVPPKHFSPVTVPFEYFNRHIYINLSLNGKPGMVFMLDSGTSSNILNMRTSEALGLKPVSIQPEKGLGLGSGRVYVAAAKDIDARIGGIQVANLMVVIDLQGLVEHLGHPIDGFLASHSCNILLSCWTSTNTCSLCCLPRDIPIGVRETGFGLPANPNRPLSLSCWVLLVSRSVAPRWKSTLEAM